jgi:hydrogenase maturation factor HypF (carbamoyltransferase family)
VFYIVSIMIACFSYLVCDRSGAKDVEELRERVRRAAEDEKALKRAEQAKVEATQLDQEAHASGSSPPTPVLKVRKDSSPIKVRSGTFQSCG